MKRILKRSGPVVCVLLMLAIPLGAALAEATSDKMVAEQILAALPSSSSASQLTRAPAQDAKRALDRAAGARRSGDAVHGEMLEGLAREWAETSRDLLRAAAVEADASAVSASAADAVNQAERSRALLEEAIARRGRAEAELEKLSADAGLFPSKPAPAPPNPGATRAKPTKTPAARPAAKGAR